MRKTMSSFRLALCALLLATLAPLACSDVTEVELLEIQGSGVLVGLAFLDLDGSTDLTETDEVLADVGVMLESPSGDLVQSETADSLGVFRFEEVPVGSYRLRLDPAALGDSLSALGDGGAFSVALDDTTELNVGAGFAELSIEEALTAPEGRRIFTSGIALNPRVNFGDGQVHFAGDSAYLRALDVERSPLAPGDSVRILGRVVTDNGRPALQNVTPFVLVPAAALVLPEDVSAGLAATADGGRLDAALVRIREAEITDTSSTPDGDFRFWAVDVSDSVEVVIREFLGLNLEAFRPDTTVRIDRLAGLLSPFQDGTGTVQWRILPRSDQDVQLETKRADISVSLTLEPTAASLGDTVEATLVAANAGPLTATGVRVRDTIPDALSFVSSSGTVGLYDSGTGIWEIGDMVPGAADTLRIRMEVADDTPPSVPVIGESLGLTLEVDPVPGNDVASALLTIS